MKYLIIILLLFLLSPSYSQIINNTYNNDKYSVKYNLINNWHFISYDDYINYASRFIFIDKYFIESIKNSQIRPLFIVSKYDKSYYGFNPHFTLCIFEDNTNINLVKMINNSIVSFEETVAPILKYTGPLETTICNKKAYNIVIEYSINDINNNNFIISEEIWYIRSNKNLYLIDSLILANHENCSKEEMKKVISSLIIY